MSRTRKNRSFAPPARTTNPVERFNKEFKRPINASEIVGGEQNIYRLLAYVALTMNLVWRRICNPYPSRFAYLKPMTNRRVCISGRIAQAIDSDDWIDHFPVH